MLSATLRAGRSEVPIGGKVRALRLEKTMGLVELWQHTRLSRALLSKDRAWTPVPDAANVLRIALAFSVGLEYFCRLTRRAARCRGAEGPAGAVTRSPWLARGRVSIRIP